MTLEKIIVTFGGLILTIFIYWFFFGKKESTASVENGQIRITVDGGYKPSVINVKKNKKVTLIFTRKDANTCLEEVIFPALKIKKYLPMNQEVSVEIEASEPGDIDFHCGMHMFHGKVLVK